MAEAPRARPESHRRLAVYSYLRSLVEGQRVLEIGCGDGESAAHLLRLGAREVVGADADPGAVAEARAHHAAPGLTFVTAGPGLRDEEAYDLVLVPEARTLLEGRGPLSLVAVRGLLGPLGRLVCVVPSADRPGGDGLGYYEVLDPLAAEFPRVRMFGQTPFAAFGLAEFDDSAGGLRVDSGLVDDGGEQPVSYVAVAGPDDGTLAFAYTLVQVPVAGLGEGAAAAEAASASNDAQAQVDGARRVARAQAEEIDELRARLRRAAEDRARLDDEVGRLRRSLAEADESVVSLTRRTTEEMASLAQRLTSGLRPAVEGQGGSALAETLRAKEAALAERESALSERDERIATLEAERQDLIWRLEASVEDLRKTTPGESEDDVVAQLRAREQALEEYRRAASAHVDEVAGLRDALNEQSAALTELEESLGVAQARAETAEQESARLRSMGMEAEDADRQRRSRLAELEGTLLRLQREASAQADRPASPGGEAVRIGELESEAEQLRSRIAIAERQRDEAEQRALRCEEQRPTPEALAEQAAAQAKLLGERDELAAQLAAHATAQGRITAERDELAHSEEFLRARVAELEARADGARLDVALAEVDRLRGALERSEEQLWEARGRLMADRERLEALERLLESGAGVGTATGETPAVIGEVLAELSALEGVLRAEAAHLEAVERTLGEWRAALAPDGAPPDVAPPVGES